MHVRRVSDQGCTFNPRAAPTAAAEAYNSPTASSNPAAHRFVALGGKSAANHPPIDDGQAHRTPSGHTLSELARAQAVRSSRMVAGSQKGQLERPSVWATARSTYLLRKTYYLYTMLCCPCIFLSLYVACSFSRTRAYCIRTHLAQTHTHPHLLEAAARPLLRRRLDQEPLRPLPHQGVSGAGRRVGGVGAAALTYCTCVRLYVIGGVRWCRGDALCMSAVPYVVPRVPSTWRSTVCRVVGRHVACRVSVSVPSC